MDKQQHQLILLIAVAVIPITMTPLIMKILIVEPDQQSHKYIESEHINKPAQKPHNSPPTRKLTKNMPTPYLSIDS